MTTLLTPEQYRQLSTLQEEVPYFIDIMGETVSAVLTGKISPQNLLQAADFMYDTTKQESQKLDESYARGDFGRPGMMDGGPNEIQFFEPQRDRCIEILESMGFS